MKKALIVLLILAVAGGLFAQEWSGGVTTGLKIGLSDDIPVTADDGDAGTPVHASLSFDNSDDDWGITVGAAADYDADGTEFTINAAKGWVDLADGLITLSAGMVGGAWGTAGPFEENVSDSIGVTVEIKPIDGLNFGFRLGYPVGDGKSAGKIGNFFQETGIGVKYDADEWGFATGIDLDSEETNGEGLDATWYFGFAYTGIEDLGIYVDGAYKNLTEKTDAKAFEIGEKVSYTAGDLGITLTLKEFFTGDFALDKFDADLGLEYGYSDTTSFGADASVVANGDFAFTSFGFDAWAKFAFNDNAWTKVVIGADIATKDNADGESTDPYLKWLFGFSF